jgi:hypothetical protein
VCNSVRHHLHGLGPTACSSSFVHRILGLPGFFFPLVDIPVLFSRDDVFPFFVDVLPIFIYIVLFVYGLVQLLGRLLFFSFLLRSSRAHPFTARRNFISATVNYFHLCASVSSLHSHIKGMELPRSYKILIGLLSWSVFPILVV